MEYDEYINSLGEYIKSYSADDRVSDEVYSARLEICKECNQLINGMCAKCGCFVQLRALKKNAKCAGEEKYW